MDESRPTKVADIEVPAEERTPLVDRLLRVIEEQQAEMRAMRDEINRLKGLPPRPTIRPSTLNAPHPDPSHKKQRRGKRPGSAKRQKTSGLIIHEIIPVPLEGLPEGTRQNGYEDFVVQDLKIEAHIPGPFSHAGLLQFNLERLTKHLRWDGLSTHPFVPKIWATGRNLPCRSERRSQSPRRGFGLATSLT